MTNNRSTLEVLHDAKRLAALAETGLLDALPQASLDRFTRIASRSIGAPVALVSLVDDRRQFFSSLVGLPEPWATARETPLSHSFCKHVVASGDALIVEDARTDERVLGNLAIPDLGVLAYAGQPIRTGDDHVLGSFCVVDSRPRVWTERELEILTDLRDAVIAEIELRRQAARHERSEEALGRVNLAILETNSALKLSTRQTIHDLRSPLSVISQGVELLRHHVAVRQFPEMGRTLERVHRNTAHAVALVADLEAAGQPRAPEAATSDLAALTRDVAHDLHTPPGRTVRVTVPPAAVPVVLAGAEARRCLENLLTNALRFARSTVDVTLHSLGSEAHLAVADDGPGLPDERACAQVWDRGVRLHVAEGLSGSGLGLSIVREIVERAGGRVTAGSCSLGGAKFTLIVPVAPVVP